MLIQNLNNIPASAPKYAGDSAVAIARPAVQQAPTSGEAPQVASQRPSIAQVQDATNRVNAAMKQANQMLEFSVDSNTQRPVVKMMDKQTGEVLRQIPSEEILAISKSIDQFLQQQGLLLNQKA